MAEGGSELAKGRTGLVVAGVDVGSVCTKTVIADHRGKSLSHNIIRSGSVFEAAAESCTAQALKLAGVGWEDLRYVVSTGYGRSKVAFTNREITEISCHARGAHLSYPEVGTVIDIGGQDSKVIRVGEGGEVLNFVMNDKCAAGTGRFLEVMAGALDTDIDHLGPLSREAEQDLEVSSMCTVFAESEVVSLIATGCEKKEIAAAIHRAITRRIAGMVGQVGIKEKVVLTGGVAKNIGVADALQRRLRVTLIIPEEPQIIGALGAAVIAAEKLASAN